MCAHCGFEVSGGRDRCPLCETALKPAERGAADLPAWEAPGTNFPANLIATWRESVLAPSRFFPRVASGASLARPLLYYLLAAIAGAGFSFWWEASGVTPDPSAILLGGDGAGPDGVGTLYRFFLSPFVALLSLFLWSVLLHGFVAMLAPERRGPGATFRVVCYSHGPAVFALLPFLGAPVGFVWQVVLQVIGIHKVHRVSAGRATAAVLLPVVLLVLVGVLVVVAAFVSGARRFL
ncbi:MAG: YIP1 family protein [Gemmatimonadota bacterium]